MMYTSCEYTSIFFLNRYLIVKKTPNILLIKESLLKLNKKVFKREDLFRVLDPKQNKELLPVGWKKKELISHLVNQKIIQKVALNTYTNRYLFNNPTIHEIGLETYPNAYLAQYTAMQFHGLTKQLPKSIYINYEVYKTNLNKGVVLEQKNIDNAFRRPKERLAHQYIYQQKDRIIYWHKKEVALRFGIIKRAVFSDKLVAISNLERTILDIVIQPLYSGGIYEVLTAFEKAAENISINKLCSYLKKLKPIYPYHQRIGFYMAKTGKYSPKQLAMLKQFEIKNKFYLSSQAKEWDYSEEWNLYYPKGF